jgi:hypothetical protein
MTLPMNDTSVARSRDANAMLVDVLCRLLSQLETKHPVRFQISLHSMTQILPILRSYADSFVDGCGFEKKQVLLPS